MNINCTSCQREIDVTDINLSEKIAKCESCNSVFSCADQLRELTPKNREMVDMPKSIQVELNKSELTITRKWLSLVSFFMVPFCIFWDGFMIMWFSIAFSKGIMIMALFGTIHGLVGVGITYFTIASIINKTLITVNDLHLTVSHGPLPWKGNAVLDSADITQLYCKQRTHRNKNSTSYSYEVYAQVEGLRKDIKIIAGAQKVEEALFIEMAVEKFLNIEDVEIKGEVEA